MPGDTVTVTAGVTVTLAAADLVGSCTLVAVTVTLSDREPGSEAGPVYRPVFDTVPTGEMLAIVPFTDHVTAVFVVPVTTAVNCCFCPGDKLTETGVTLTATDVRDWSMGLSNLPAPFRSASASSGTLAGVP